MARAIELKPPATDWSEFATHHKRIQSPLRPVVQDVRNIEQSIRESDGFVLLLGVTPELASLGQSLLAADGSPRMIEEAWPGDSQNRRAILADWRALPVKTASVDAVVGDGSLNVVAEGLPALLLEIKRVLAPGGVAAFPTFCSPARPESLSDIVADVRGGWSGNFHALKWRVAMAVAAQHESHTISVKEILEAFETIFPDRHELRDITGWSEADISTIDYYKVAAYRMGFPTETRLQELANQCSFSARVTQSNGCPLAERCPIIVLSVAG